jgi:hypothetical protein
MSGTKANQWEGHMAEIMWRADVKGDRYGAFFDLLRSIYTLQEPPQYMYTTPLCDSWSGTVGNMTNWTVEPEVTDAGSESSSSVDENPESYLTGTPPIPRTTPSPSSHPEDDIVTISSDEDVPTAAQRERKSANLRPETVHYSQTCFQTVHWMKPLCKRLNAPLSSQEPV